MAPSNGKKRQRVAHQHRQPSTIAATVSRLSSTAALIESFPDQTLTETSQKLCCPSPYPHYSAASSSSTSIFNDPTTADVILRLFQDPTTPFTDTADSVSSMDDVSDVQIYLHSDVLRKAQYFNALLSDRWQQDNNTNATKSLISLNLGVPPNDDAFMNHFTVFELLYTNDFANVVNSASTALDILPIALELLFEECVKSCVKFLEAVPWSEEEERRVMGLIPLLSEEESRELLSRVSPEGEDACEEMLDGLITAAIHSHPNMAFAKAFVAKLLREFSWRESARRVLERAFGASLKVVNESLEEYSSPDFRGDHNETEAIQRLNLHTAMTNGRHLVWLIERMIELRVADCAVKEWSEQGAFTADLQRAFRDDAWRNIVPGLPAVVLRCTCKLANAVAAGTILASRQVRKKLVKDWLPVLIVCKDNVSFALASNKPLYLELEETFLRIISTLPMSDAQELLKQCLSFSTRNVEDCPHLVTAFNTWFRRATQRP
ncbi:hypothetical protein K2173_002417 [Erythroxylum novogranatense]|uniref:At3g05675-like ankyrin-like domain-containing protein n=1 Tax=Erythroxylum novogranatense TaxID=1862640 RepID=A0AAV8TB28_9ROSI|nr:hypothetical protein K2173_002417 [Erythroxylum novogranatense]